MGSSSDVPALRRGLAILGALAERPGPVSAGVLARELGIPRSTTYHLLAELVDAGYATHLPEERRYGLGVSAFEIGSAYLRHDPLERLAGPLLRKLVDRVGHNAHLGVLHGGESLYLVKERPSKPETLVTDVGVRLPAQLTASGRSMLARLPAAQVRALLPTKSDFVLRTRRGPRDLPGLRRTLAAERRLGWAVEDGHVTTGFASVASPVFDHGGRPTAAISVTFRHVCEDVRDAGDQDDGDQNIGDQNIGEQRGSDQPCGRTWPNLAEQVRNTAAELTARISGRSTPT